MSKKKMQGKGNLFQDYDNSTTVRKFTAIIIISLILILIIGGVSAYLYIKSAMQPVNPDSEENVKVSIPRGTSIAGIANQLEDKGLIKDDTVFKYYIKFKGEGDFQAGKYTFSPSMEFGEFITALQEGKMSSEPNYKVTIPEGKTVESIAKKFAEKLPFSERDFLKKVNKKSYIEQLIDKYPDILSDDILKSNIKTPLEGYLFAATYKFYKENPTVETVINRMVTKTDKVVTSYMNDIEESNFTVHETLTMASLVENEASSVEQRRKIAGLFYNRLDEGMPLQTDPTVLYALDEHKKRVLNKDLEVDSPYNTYRVDSLPAGPISNFAESSLKATLKPEETDALYFLHDDEGNIHYSDTNKEHNRLKEKYLK